MVARVSVDSYPVYTGRSYGSSWGKHDEDRYGGFAALVFGTVIFLLLTSAARHWRRRERYRKRQHAKKFDDDVPPSTGFAPIEVRADGPLKSMVILGDDDKNFCVRARAGVLLTLTDGSKATLLEGTPLKCTFPGFSLVTNATGRSSVYVDAGTTFYIVATRGELETAGQEAAHPFRGAAMTIPLGPVGDRYECRLDPKPVVRKRLARILPAVSLHEPPRWRPHLYPGIPCALLVLCWAFVLPWVTALVYGLSFMVLLTIEEAAWKMSGDD